MTDPEKQEMLSLWKDADQRLRDIEKWIQEKSRPDVYVHFRTPAEHMNAKECLEKMREAEAVSSKYRALLYEAGKAIQILRPSAATTDYGKHLDSLLERIRRFCEENP